MRITKAERTALHAKGRKWCSRCRKAKVFSAFSTMGRDRQLAAYCTKCKTATTRLALTARRGEVDPTIAERWFAKVDMGRRANDCWLWTGAMKDGGGTRHPYWYGAICHNGNYNAAAHRIGFTLLTGYPLETQDRLRNVCGTGAQCVRYDHWDFPDPERWAPKLATKAGRTRRKNRDVRILAQVESAIPAGLPDDVRDVMRQELVLLALTGRQTHINRVTPNKVKRALKEAWADRGDPYGLSLDEPIGDDTDLTHRDLIVDTGVFSDPEALVHVASLVA